MADQNKQNIVTSGLSPLVQAILGNRMQGGGGMADTVPAMVEGEQPALLIYHSISFFIFYIQYYIIN